MATRDASPRDQNRVPALLGVSSTDGETAVPVYVDEATNRLLVNTAGGGGTSETDDAAFIAGGGAGTPMMGFATADTVDAGDVGVLAMDTSRNLKVSIEADNVGIGGSTQYDIQDAAGGTDTGNIALVQRNDTLADLSGGDGAYTPMQVNASGALYTAISGNLPDTAAGDLAAINGAITGSLDVSGATVTVDLSTNNDVVVTDGTDTISVLASGADNVSNDENELVTASLLYGWDGSAWDRLNASGGNLVVNVGNFATGQYGNTDDTAANLTSALVFAEMLVYDGSTWDRLRGDATDGALVNLGSNNDVDLNAGTNYVGKVRLTDGTNDASVDASSGAQFVGGDIAHDSADDGNPVKIGGVARESNPTAVAGGDRVDAFFDVEGKQIVVPYAPQTNTLNGTASATDTSDTAVIAAQGTGVRIYLTSIIISNSSDTFVEIDIKDGTATKLTYPAPATGGAVHNLNVPLRLTANTALNFASSASVSSITVSALGYKSV